MCAFLKLVVVLEDQMEAGNPSIREEQNVSENSLVSCSERTNMAHFRIINGNTSCVSLPFKMSNLK